MKLTKMNNTSKDWIFDLYVKEFIKPKLLPTDFYYGDDGNMVMTESYHHRRGSCCGNGCCSFVVCGMVVVCSLLGVGGCAVCYL